MASQPETQPRLMIDIGLAYCRACCNASRLYLVKTDVPGSTSVKLLVCRHCDRGGLGG